MQELMVRSTDRALHESGLQLHSQNMGLYQVNQLWDHSWKEKDWLCAELEEEREIVL